MDSIISYIGVLLFSLIFTVSGIAQKAEYAVISKNKSNLEIFDENSHTSLMGMLSYNINSIPHFLEENNYQGCYDINQLKKLNLDESDFIKFTIRPKFLIPRTFSQDTVAIQKTKQNFDVFFDSLLNDPDYDILYNVDRKLLKQFWDQTDVNGIVRMSYDYYFSFSGISKIICEKVNEIEWVHLVKKFKNKEIPVLTLKKQQLYSVCETYYFEPNNEEQKIIIDLLRTSQLTQFENCKLTKSSYEDNCLGDFCNYYFPIIDSEYGGYHLNWDNPYAFKSNFIHDIKNHKLKHLFAIEELKGKPYVITDFKTYDSVLQTYKSIFLVKTDNDFTKSIANNEAAIDFKDLYQFDTLFKTQYNLTALNDTVRHKKEKGIFWADIENPHLFIEFTKLKDSAFYKESFSKNIVVYQPEGNNKNLVMNFYYYNYFAKEEIDSIDYLLYQYYDSISRNLSFLDKPAYSIKIGKKIEKSLKYLINY